MFTVSVAAQDQNSNLLYGSNARSYKLYALPSFPTKMFEFDPFSWPRLIVCVLLSIYNKHDEH